MNAIEILRAIVADGYLSDTNNARAQQLITKIDAELEVSGAFLAECREEYLRGDKVGSVKRYRAGTGCGLREAKTPFRRVRNSRRNHSPNPHRSFG